MNTQNQQPKWWEQHEVSPPQGQTLVQVDIIESERGWGQKLDSSKWFNDREAAEAFVADYNSVNTSLVVPDWYMYAKIVS